MVADDAGEVGVGVLPALARPDQALALAGIGDGLHHPLERPVGQPAGKVDDRARKTCAPRLEGAQEVPDEHPLVVGEEATRHHA